MEDNKSRNRNKVIALLVVFFAAVTVTYAVTNNGKVPVRPAIKAPVASMISVTEDGFSPQTVKVKAGTVVVWTNVDNVAHRIAANPIGTHKDLPTLDSKINISTNGTYRYTFNQPGTFNYHDELNPTVNGTIIVN